MTEHENHILHDSKTIFANCQVQKFLRLRYSIPKLVNLLCLVLLSALLLTA